MKTRTCLLMLWGLLLAVSEFPALATYNPQTGRWLNRDPIGEKGGFHPFSFGDNSPIDTIDPTGLMGCAPCKICCCANSVNITGPTMLYTPWTANTWGYGGSPGFMGYGFSARISLSYQTAPLGSVGGDCRLQWHEENSANSTVNATILKPGQSGTYTDSSQTSMLAPWSSKKKKCPPATDTIIINDTPGVNIPTTTTTGYLELLIDITVTSAPGCGCSVSSASATVLVKVNLVGGAPLPGWAGSGFWVLN